MEGFKNEMLKKLHDVGTRIIKETKLSIHENVLGYEEDIRCCSCLVLLTHESLW